MYIGYNPYAAPPLGHAPPPPPKPRIPYNDGNKKETSSADEKPDTTVGDGLLPTPEMYGPYWASVMAYYSQTSGHADSTDEAIDHGSCSSYSDPPTYPCMDVGKQNPGSDVSESIAIPKTHVDYPLHYDSPTNEKQASVVTSSGVDTSDIDGVPLEATPYQHQHGNNKHGSGGKKPVKMTFGGFQAKRPGGATSAAINPQV